MKIYRDWDFGDIQIGNLLLNITYNGVFIESITPPSPHIEDKHKDTINELIKYVNVNEIEIEIEIQSSNIGIYVMASCNKEDLIDLDDINIDVTYIEDYFVDETSVKLDIFKYVPVLSHTTTTPVVLCNIIEDYGNDFIPYLYMEELSRLENYQEQNYDFLHFLDLWYMHEIINEKIREELKIENKQRREIGQKSKKLPNKQYRKSSKAEILTYYNTLKNNFIIPVIEIEDDYDFLKIKDMNVFDKVALRIIFNIDTIDLIVKIYKENISFLEKFERFWIIFDSNTLNDFNIINHYISQLIYSSDKLQFVYLGSPFKSKDISIPRYETNTNKILFDKTLEIYRQLSSLHNIPVWYGDYGGFEKRTPSKGMGKPTARVVIRSHHNDNILVRRGWDEKDLKDNGNIGYTYSMEKLLGDINIGAIPNEYLNEELCDVDYALKTHGAKSIRMGDLKTYCFRHNVCSILKRFIIS